MPFPTLVKDPIGKTIEAMHVYGDFGIIVFTNGEALLFTAVEEEYEGTPVLAYRLLSDNFVNRHRAEEWAEELLREHAFQLYEAGILSSEEFELSQEERREKFARDKRNRELLELERLRGIYGDG